MDRREDEDRQIKSLTDSRCDLGTNRECARVQHTDNQSRRDRKEQSLLLLCAQPGIPLVFFLPLMSPFFFSLTSLLPSLYLACVPIWFGLIWFGRLSYPISACVYAPCNRTTAVGLTCALAVLRKHQAPHHGLILSHFQAQTCHGLFKMILPDTAPASLDLDSLTHLVMHPFPPSIAWL